MVLKLKTTITIIFLNEWIKQRALRTVGQCKYGNLNKEQKHEVQERVLWWFKNICINI